MMVQEEGPQHVGSCEKSRRDLAKETPAESESARLLFKANVVSTSKTNILRKAPSYSDLARGGRHIHGTENAEGLLKSYKQRALALRAS